MISYSIYEAKARFSEVIRQVRQGGSVVVTYRGEPVAEIRPIQPEEPELERRLLHLQQAGVLQGGTERRGELEPVARRAGALERFLSERDG